MTFRTLLLIGSVSVLALTHAVSAEEISPRTLLVAQAEMLPLLEEEAARAAEQASYAAAIAAEAEEAAKLAVREVKRAERAAAKGGEAEQQAAGEAAARAEEAVEDARAARRAAKEAEAFAEEKQADFRSASKNAAQAERNARKAEQAEAQRVADEEAAKIAEEEAAQAAEENARTRKKAERAARAAEEEALRAAEEEAAKIAEEEAAQAAEENVRARKKAERAAKAAEEEALRAAEEEAARAVQQARPAAPESEQPEMTREERRKKRRDDRAAEQHSIDDAAEDQIAPAPTQSNEVSPTGQPGNLREKRRQERQRRREQLKASPVAPEPSEPAPVAKGASPVEQQIQIQRGSAEVEELRRLRKKLDRERKRVEVLQEQAAPDQAEPDEDANDARSKRQRERDRRNQTRNPQQLDSTGNERAERTNGDRADRGEVVKRQGDRIIIRLGDQLVIQPNRESDRFLSGARDVEVEDLGRGQTRTTVYRENGVKIVTLRDRYGDILLRTRVLPGGRRIVLIDNRDIEKTPRRGRHYGEIDPLPPLVLRIPRDEYIVETRRASRRQIQETLVAPPVERVERAYTLDEVRYSDRLREKVRRVDLDTITFAFGSAAIGLDQLDSLDSVGQAIEDLVRKNPDEIFLIEGHTDAVGSEQANLLLSDQRAEAVAVALSEDFDIPPENLVTQGYGEQQLKIITQAPERENRRVAIRRITPLLRAGR
ncbi:MAG: OmpA family protein [Alphaproteobacteria bacterium]|nr:OmpA family protein [Alphaproteobacteria bacterium]MBU0805375.1 OmpA family protein [Alphaproteobacteria bacterium]MBU0873321.1 OmpA family protein [Alphaproteobacteria bacterium]MBU1401451.1 OmpA family protein [Alphaproteobacteria bacterium]MBU1592132.1 OmpA family protein [Alphaproteobacteria bacterium]